MNYLKNNDNITILDACCGIFQTDINMMIMILKVIVVYMKD